MATGSFQTNREIFQNPIWKNLVEFRLFFLIYGNAVFSHEGVRVSDDLTLQRGQWLRSTRKLQEDLEYIENRQVKTYSTSVINRCIKKLEQSQRICTKTHELGTVFTVLNYELYQGFGGMPQPNLERNLEHSGNSGRTVEEQSGNNNKNVKKDKNDLLDMRLSEFELFWAYYPQKKGKAKAQKKWLSYGDKIDIDAVLAGTKKYVEYCKATNRFFMDGSTFVNNQSWGEEWSLPTTSVLPQNSTPKPHISKYNNKTAPVLDNVTLTQEEDEWLERAEREQYRRNHNSRNNSHIPELARSLP